MTCGSKVFFLAVTQAIVQAHTPGVSEVIYKIHCEHQSATKENDHHSNWYMTTAAVQTAEGKTTRAATSVSI